MHQFSRPATYARRARLPPHEIRVRDVSARCQRQRPPLGSRTYPPSPRPAKVAIPLAFPLCVGQEPCRGVGADSVPLCRTPPGRSVCGRHDGCRAEQESLREAKSSSVERCSGRTSPADSAAPSDPARAAGYVSASPASTYQPLGRAHSDRQPGIVLDGRLWSGRCRQPDHSECGGEAGKARREPGPLGVRWRRERGPFLGTYMMRAHRGPGGRIRRQRSGSRSSWRRRLRRPGGVPRRRVAVAAVPWLCGAFLVLIGAAWIIGQPARGGAGRGGSLREGAGRRRRPALRQALARARGFGAVLSPECRAALRPGGAVQEQGGAEDALAAAHEPHVLSSGRPRVRPLRLYSLYPADGLCELPAPGAPLDAGGRHEHLCWDIPPYVYTLPGLLMHLTRDPLAAMRLGRLRDGGRFLGLLALAFFLLWDDSRGAISLAGFFGALTPAVVYFSSTLNPRTARRSRALSAFARRCCGSRAAASSHTRCGGGRRERRRVGHQPSPGPRARLRNRGLRGAARRTPPLGALTARGAAPGHRHGGAVALGALAGIVWEVAAQPHPPGDNSVRARARAVGVASGRDRPSSDRGLRLGRHAAAVVGSGRLGAAHGRAAHDRRRRGRASGTTRIRPDVPARDRRGDRGYGRAPPHGVRRGGRDTCFPSS